MVSLDVKLIKTPFVFCYESAIATVANWVGRDYQMIFSTMLGFGYKHDEITREKAHGKDLYCGYCVDDFFYFDDLRKYHGMEASFLDVNPDTVMQEVKKEIDGGMPVMVYLEHDFCPWTKEDLYRTYYLITGYDDSYVYGYDLHSNDETMMKLEIEMLKEDYSHQNQILIFRKLDTQTQATFDDLKAVIKAKGYDSGVAFEEMKKFADELIAYFTDNKYDKDKTHFRQVDILEPLGDIVRGRKLFADTCYYLAKANNDEFADYVGFCYEDVSELWNTVWRMAGKAYLLNRGDTLSERTKKTIVEAAGKIYEIAEREKKIIDIIFGDRSNIVAIRKPLDHINDVTGLDEVTLDLSNLYNNKCFEEEGGIKPDLTGQGEHFKASNLGEDRTLNVGGRSFVIGKGKDNFVCSGQSVSVPKDKYKALALLGCAEWGGGSGKAFIGNDMTSDILYVDLSDWFYCKMNNAWKGAAIDYEGNEVDRGLFCVNYELNPELETDRIVFPKISNAHIFAIKLYK